jgi:DNA-binding protein H-NS
MGHGHLGANCQGSRSPALFFCVSPSGWMLVPTTRCFGCSREFSDALISSDPNRFHASVSCGGPNMNKSKLETMPLDELWKLHGELIAALASRMEAQKLRLEKRLDELGVGFGGSPRDIPQPRPYPKVLPKFRNPEASEETWSGRGRQPHWVLLLLARGGTLDDCRIQ